MIHKILWIEDNANYKLRHTKAAVEAIPIYDLDLSETITDAYRQICSYEYDLVIADLRMDAGDSHWERYGNNKSTDKLGLKFLEWLLQKKYTNDFGNPPTWIKPEMVGIFSIEHLDSIKNDVISLGIPENNVQNKNEIVSQSNGKLLELIQRILASVQNR
jgi:hypothetical protein